MKYRVLAIAVVGFVLLVRGAPSAAPGEDERESRSSYSPASTPPPS